MQNLVLYYNSILNVIVSYVEIILNTISVLIVVFSVAVGIVKQCKGEGSARHIICKGISNAFNYNLATEVLKILVGREIKELMVIGGILILKAMITCLFMLELKQEEMQEKNDLRENKKIKRKK